MFYSLWFHPQEHQVLLWVLPGHPIRLLVIKTHCGLEKNWRRREFYHNSFFWSVLAGVKAVPLGPSLLCLPQWDHCTISVPQHKRWWCKSLRGIIILFELLALVAYSFCPWDAILAELLLALITIKTCSLFSVWGERTWGVNGEDILRGVNMEFLSTAFRYSLVLVPSFMLQNFLFACLISDTPYILLNMVKHWGTQKGD